MYFPDALCFTWLYIVHASTWVLCTCSRWVEQFMYHHLSHSMPSKWAHGKFLNESHIFISIQYQDWGVQTLRWCKTLQRSPSWRWRGLLAPGCPGLWRIHARGRCGRCLCGWASRRGTTSLAAQSTGSSPACQWRCPAAARRWPGNDGECPFWSAPGGQRETDRDNKED